MHKIKPESKVGPKSAAKSENKPPLKTEPKIMPKKNVRPPEEDKVLEIDMEEKIVDPELLSGEETDEELEEEGLLDEEEVDPFKDKWEE